MLRTGNLPPLSPCTVVPPPSHPQPCGSCQPQQRFFCCQFRLCLHCNLPLVSFPVPFQRRIAHGGGAQRRRSFHFPPVLKRNAHAGLRAGVTNVCSSFLPLIGVALAAAVMCDTFIDCAATGQEPIGDANTTRCQNATCTSDECCIGCYFFFPFHLWQHGASSSLLLRTWQTSPSIFPRRYSYYIYCIYGIGGRR